MVDEAVKAKQYYSDGFDAYYRLWYHYGHYEVSEGKTDTYSVEGDNAELRHYPARLARRSRCFSRSLEALEWAVLTLCLLLQPSPAIEAAFSQLPGPCFSVCLALDLATPNAANWRKTRKCIV